MSKTTINSFIDKLNQVPPEVHSLLSQIRQEDKKVLELEMQIQPEKQFVLEGLSDMENKKPGKQRQKLEEQFESIRKKTEKQIQLTKKKIFLAEKLYNCIDQPTEILDKELAIKQSEDNTLDLKQKHTKSKRSKQQNELQYDPCEPHYCYCDRPSFGSMVMCENPLCATQWFHVSCVEEQISSGDEWYCKNCRKERPKGRKGKKNKGIL